MDYHFILCIQTSDKIAFLSLLVAIGSLGVAVWAIIEARKARKDQRKIETSKVQPFLRVVNQDTFQGNNIILRILNTGKNAVIENMIITGTPIRFMRINNSHDTTIFSTQRDNWPFTFEPQQTLRFVFEQTGNFIPYNEINSRIELMLRDSMQTVHRHTIVITEGQIS